MKYLTFPLFLVVYCVIWVVMEQFLIDLLGLKVAFLVIHSPEEPNLSSRWELRLAGLETVQDRWRHVGRDTDIIRFVVSCGALTDEEG